MSATDPDPDPDTGEGRILARLEASSPRRFFALGVLYGLGALLVWLILDGGRGWGATAGLSVIAALAFWQAERMRAGTRGAVLLTPDGLCDAAGRVLAPLDEIERVDRGLFAFKPSNGFLVILRRPAPRIWVPGLWWRMGRRVGVGGVTSASRAKSMADQLTLMVHDRGRRRDGAL